MELKEKTKQQQQRKSFSIVGRSMSEVNSTIQIVEISMEGGNVTFKK